MVPTFVVSYLIYDSAEKEHDRYIMSDTTQHILAMLLSLRLQRKQPGQFDHEV